MKCNTRYGNDKEFEANQVANFLYNLPKLGKLCEMFREKSANDGQTTYFFGAKLALCDK